MYVGCCSAAARQRFGLLNRGLVVTSQVHVHWRLVVCPLDSVDTVAAEAVDHLHQSNTEIQRRTPWSWSKLKAVVFRWQFPTNTRVLRRRDVVSSSQPSHFV